MEYSIKELSNLAGVSPRTLRYYDEIGLLRPLRTNEAGYRFYGEKEVALLQQILFYRERGLRLEQIKVIVYEENFDLLSALYTHLEELENKKQRLDHMISIVKKTISAAKGENIMSDKERFEVWREKEVRENEERFGQEVREKYGENAMAEATEKMMGMTEYEYQKFKNLEKEVLLRLQEAVSQGSNPKSEEGKKIVLLHREWLGMTWKTYTGKAHCGVAKMYVLDERFTAYYDAEVKGCAAFLRDAVLYWVKE